MANGNECKDYRLTTDFAKHLCMESHSERGKQARQYFITVEQRAKQYVIDRTSLSPQMQMFYAIADSQAKMELEQTAHCSLKRLCENKRERMEKAGNTKTCIKNETTKIAIIEGKPQLKAIFENIVRRYAMSYCA